ncbi:MAG TPA: hypothetical protein VJY62_14665 [Bacteroidia bacterium]|nr:hypothetical protein [Bacteroidia bacterium]
MADNEEGRAYSQWLYEPVCVQREVKKEGISRPNGYVRAGKLNSLFISQSPSFFTRRQAGFF